MRLSLLDIADCRPVEYLLVYQPRCETSGWWVRWLDPAFAHVEIWRYLGENMYEAVQPFHEFLACTIVDGPPQGLVQKVTALRRRGKVMWPIGLKTCVTVAKAMIGLKAAWVLTPKQLHRYIENKGGLIG